MTDGKVQKIRLGKPNAQEIRYGNPWNKTRRLWPVMTMSKDRPKITDGRAQIAPAKDRPKLFLLAADTPPTIAIAPKTKRGTPTAINRPTMSAQTSTQEYIGQNGAYSTAGLTAKATIAPPPITSNVPATMLRIPPAVSNPLLLTPHPFTLNSLFPRAMKITASIPKTTDGKLQKIRPGDRSRPLVTKSRPRKVGKPGAKDRPKITDGRAQIAPAKDKPKLFLRAADTPPIIAIAPKTNRGTPTIINPRTIGSTREGRTDKYGTPNRAWRTGGLNAKATIAPPPITSNAPPIMLRIPPAVSNPLLRPPLDSIFSPHHSVLTSNTVNLNPTTDLPIPHLKPPIPLRPSTPNSHNQE
jgi:hypothetical protein